MVSIGHQLVGLLSAVELFVVVDRVVDRGAAVVRAAVQRLDSGRSRAAAHRSADGVVAAAVVVGC